MELIPLGGGDIFVCIKGLGSFPGQARSLGLAGDALHGRPTLLNLLIPGTGEELIQIGLGLLQLGVLLFDLGLGPADLIGERGLQLPPARPGGGQARLGLVASAQEQVRIQGGKGHAFGHGVAFLHGQVDQLTGNLEGQIDGSQFDVSGEENARGSPVSGFVQPEVGHDCQDDDEADDGNDFFDDHSMLLMVPMASPRLMRWRL